MNNFTKYLSLTLVCCAILNVQNISSELPRNYPLIIERLLYFKHDDFKVFFGGPVDRKNQGVKWIMPIVFEDDLHKTRAVYEVAFVNCDLKDAEDAEILFIDVADINIKFRNMLSPDNLIFASLLNGEYKADKYIVVRFADIANIYYPDVFVFSEYGEKKPQDKDDIAKFLHQQFKTSAKYKNYYNGGIVDEVKIEDENNIVYKSVLVHINFDGKAYPFWVEKRIKKYDIWKVYYVISKVNYDVNGLDRQKMFSDMCCLRIDSGCVSGQLYNDEACDCFDQLHNCLKQIALDNTNNGIVIHIPGQDGRGFGTAPKAETEIYKRGGRGRLHTTVSLDTVAAAKLLYGVDSYDLRTFDGAVKILLDMGIRKVQLFTDNIEKVDALKRYGIDVIRQKTNTNKTSCLQHIDAKKNSKFYFSE